jgi:hypothetical protein
LFELPVLFEDRDHLVDQSLKLIVTGILAILLELTDPSLVIGASLPQEKSVKVKTTRGLPLPFQLLLVPDLASTFSMCRWAILQIRAPFLGHRNYR